MLKTPKKNRELVKSKPRNIQLTKKPLQTKTHNSEEISFSCFYWDYAWSWEK